MDLQIICQKKMQKRHMIYMQFQILENLFLKVYSMILIEMHQIQSTIKIIIEAHFLLIAGENDHTVPAAVTKSNYDKYNKSNAITDFHEFKGRSHLIMLEEGWEEVVDYIDNWIKTTLK